MRYPDDRSISSYTHTHTEIDSRNIYESVDGHCVKFQTKRRVRLPLNGATPPSSTSISAYCFQHGTRPADPKQLRRRHSWIWKRNRNRNYCEWKFWKRCDVEAMRGGCFLPTAKFGTVTVAIGSVCLSLYLSFTFSNS